MAKEVKVVQVNGSSADVIDTDDRNSLHRNLQLEGQAIRDQIQRGDIVVVDDGLSRVIRKR